MVHLARIPTEQDIKGVTDAVNKVQLQLSNEEDCFTTSVYGSRFAAEDLPKHEMPENEMPRDIAYRMIKGELSLDGNPMLKYVRFFSSKKRKKILCFKILTSFFLFIFTFYSLASFVTTYMVS